MDSWVVTARALVADLSEHRPVFVGHRLAFAGLAIPASVAPSRAT